MKLVLEEPNSNWDKYARNGIVHSIAKPNSGCHDSVFGSYSYFVRYVDLYASRDKDFINQLTDFGYEIYKENGGKFGE